MATGCFGAANLPDGQASPKAQKPPTAAPCPDDASMCSSAASSAVLDKLAGLEVARKAERERRRENSRAAADPRESVAKFLKNFAARQRNIDDALHRMLLIQGQEQQQQQELQRQQQQRDQQGLDQGALELAPLEVSIATPEQVQCSLELVSAEVLSLEQAAAVASYYLPAYDQKQCATVLAALRAAIEGVRASLTPRRRFAFGSKKMSKVRGEEVSAAASSAASASAVAAAAATSVAPSSSLTPAVSTLVTAASTSVAAAATSPEVGPVHGASAVARHQGQAAAATTACSRSETGRTMLPADGTGSDSDAPVVVTISEQDRALVERGRGLLGLSDATVVLPADVVSDGGTGGDFVLLGLTRCTVVLLGRLRALRIAGLRRCTVVAGPVTGACFVDDVRSSRLALATYQVRVHRTHATDLFLRVRSKPMIEHSTGIRVAPWTAAVVPEPRLERLLQELMLGQETGCWQQVEDFGWIKAVQSPNWSLLPPEGQPQELIRVPPAVWQQRADKGATAAATAAAASGQRGVYESGRADSPAQVEDGDEI